jgi:hypothetical protein
MFRQNLPVDIHDCRSGAELDPAYFAVSGGPSSRCV